MPEAGQETCGCQENDHENLARPEEDKHIRQGAISQENDGKSATY